MHNQGRAGTPSKPFFCLQPELRARSPLAGPRSPDARAGRGHGQVASAGRAQGKLTPGGSVSPGAPPARAQLGAGGGGGGGGGGRGGGSICGRGKPGAQVPASSLEGPGPDAASGNAPSRPQPANRFLVAGGLPPHKG